MPVKLGCAQVFGAFKVSMSASHRPKRRYIFEKYINQKQMGAYYTREDITEYISKNTVIPHLLDQARERCKVAFEGDLSVWSLLKTDPDRYIYPAMKTGVIDSNGQLVPVALLPDFVQTGMNDPKARMFERRYNLGEAVLHITSSNGQTQRGTLPTETWREYVDRRSRCIDVRDKLTNGEVKSADDIDTLATRNSDRLDFHEVSVWGLKEALQAAFTAGQQSKQTTQPN